MTHFEGDTMHTPTDLLSNAAFGTLSSLGETYMPFLRLQIACLTHRSGVFLILLFVLNREKLKVFVRALWSNATMSAKE